MVCCVLCVADVVGVGVDHLSNEPHKTGKGPSLHFQVGAPR